ncbi:hypothetical protein KKE60_06440 [Patescibacteria group bacterium]|nr:hypothetical protein [Patescibacteria group bacterium]
MLDAEKDRAFIREVAQSGAFGSELRGESVRLFSLQVSAGEKLNDLDARGQWRNYVQRLQWELEDWERRLADARRKRSELDSEWEKLVKDAEAESAREGAASPPPGYFSDTTVEIVANGISWIFRKK